MPTGVYGLPSAMINPKYPWLRQYSTGASSTSGTQNSSFTLPPLGGPLVYLAGVERQGHSSIGMYSMSLAGYDWSSGPSRTFPNVGYPPIDYAVGRSNGSPIGTSFSVYHEGNWTGHSVYEFIGIKGEVLDQYSSWSSPGTSTYTLPWKIKERGLVLLAIGCNDTGGGVGSRTGANLNGWIDVSGLAYNYHVSYFINPPVGFKPSVTFNEPTNSGGNPTALFLLFR